MKPNKKRQLGAITSPATQLHLLWKTCGCKSSSGQDFFLGRTRSWRKNQALKRTWAATQPLDSLGIPKQRQLNPCSGYVVWSITRSLALPSPAFQESMAESCGLFFAALGSWAKHCVWQKVPWNTMGIIYTVIPYSPHLHPPCSVLYGFTEHEGWELINFTLMYMCPN